ncbi:hypothetical protein Bca52824_038322 [Brassica carinata]|uniref:Uncharacterized protein n=1 Tax=Brassica carinata TaxID=52824 RepID=A0A8X7RLZ7_BRACI|nr:hypothetical protein Bca52824_038322 [Brassica carinata]
MKKDAFSLPFSSPGSRRLALPKKGQAENPLEEQGANDYPGDDVSGAQSVTEKLSDLAQNGVPVNNNQCDSGQ